MVIVTFDTNTTQIAVPSFLRFDFLAKTTIPRLVPSFSILDEGFNDGYDPWIGKTYEEIRSRCQNDAHEDNDFPCVRHVIYGFDEHEEQK